MRGLWFIVALAFGLTVYYHYPAKSAEPVDAAIVFVVDMSQSVNAQERALIRDGHREAVQSEAFMSSVLYGGRNKRIAVAYVEFADYAITIVPWRIISSQDDAAIFAAMIPARGQGCDVSADCGTSTNVAGGMMEAAKLIDSLPYVAGHIIVDIVGDGKQNVPSTGNDASYEQLVTAARDELLRRGATVNALVIERFQTDQGLEAFYTYQVVGGPSAFMLPIDEISQFPLALHQKLMREMF